MENQTNVNQDCGCSDGCCTPSKNSPWKKWLFIAVILAAGIIVAIKIIGGNSTTPTDCCETVNKETPSCCPK